MAGRGPLFPDRHECLQWLQLLWPTAIGFGCRFGMELTDVTFVGRLTADPRYPTATPTDFLSAVGIATTWIAVTSVFIYRGFAPTLTTLASQAYGAGNFSLLDAWLKVCVVLGLLACLPVAGLWWFGGRAMGALLGPAGCGSVCVQLVDTFCRASIPRLFASLLFESLAAHLQAQKVVLPALATSALFFGLNFASNAVLIHGVFGWGGLGFVGSPVATAVTQWLRVAALYALVALRRGPADGRAAAPINGQGPGRSVWTRQRVATFLGQCVPMAAAGCVEEYQIELTSVFAGRLGPTPVAAHYGMLVVFQMLTSVQMAVMTATVVRVAHHLGERAAGRARAVMRFSFAVGSGAGAAIGVLFVAARNVLGRLYSDDPDIWATTASISLIVGIVYGVVSAAFVAMAVLEAQSRPTVLAALYFVGMWLIGAPLAWLLGLHLGVGLPGIWYALSAGYTFIAALSTLAVATSNWDAIVDRIAVRNAIEADDEKSLLVNGP